MGSIVESGPEIQRKISLCILNIQSKFYRNLTNSLRDNSSFRQK
jgi:hypothetical protein